MSTVPNYQCDAWLVEDEDQHVDDDSLLESVFEVDLYAPILIYDSMEEGETREYATSLKRFKVSRDYLLHAHTSWMTIVNWLTEVNIPSHDHPMMIQKIMACAHESYDMTDDKIIRMVVSVRALQSSYGISEALRESFNSQGLSFVRASESSIEALEKVEIKGLSKQCVICLEDILIGMEGTRMPCSHVYHGSCIRIWLQNSNLCPLCRFHMSA